MKQKYQLGDKMNVQFTGEITGVRKLESTGDHVYSIRAEGISKYVQREAEVYESDLLKIKDGD